MTGQHAKFSVLAVSDFNPFLISNLDRGREVHLPGYKPTDKADVSLFGTADDTSSPASNKYYLSADNLPWAAMYPQPVKYPIERININQAYVHYDEWSRSGGTLYPDWHDYNKPGYANKDKLYLK